jgi:hypothetical protein
MIPLIAAGLILLLRIKRARRVMPVTKTTKSPTPRIPQPLRRPRVTLQKTHHSSLRCTFQDPVRLARHRSPFLPPLKNIPGEE